MSVTVGKLDTQPEKVLTTETFRKIEVEMELGRNSILKLKRILGQVVTVETGVREALRSWDRMGANQLELSRIGNFELKIPATKGKKGKKGTPAHVEVNTIVCSHGKGCGQDGGVYSGAEKYGQRENSGENQYRLQEWKFEDLGEYLP